MRGHHDYQICSKKGEFICNFMVSDGENKHISEKMWVGLRKDDQV